MNKILCQHQSWATGVSVELCELISIDNLDSLIYQNYKVVFLELSY